MLPQWFLCAPGWVHLNIVSRVGVPSSWWGSRSPSWSVSLPIKWLRSVTCQDRGVPEHCPPKHIVPAGSPVEPSRDLVVSITLPPRNCNSSGKQKVETNTRKSVISICQSTDHRKVQLFHSGDINIHFCHRKVHWYRISCTPGGVLTVLTSRAVTAYIVAFIAKHYHTSVLPLSLPSPALALPRGWRGKEVKQ